MSMNTLSNAAPPLPRSVLKTVAVLICIAGALAAAIYLKSLDTAVHKTTQPPPPTPGEILAAIPLPAGKSAGENAVVEAVTKAKADISKPHVWVALGDALAQRLRETNNQTLYDFASSAYQQALRLDPNWVDAMNGMAWVEGGCHRFDASMKWANKALALAPESADSHGILGDAALELGDYQAATGHYQKMMDLRPDLSSWSRGAWLLWITGNPVEATSLMEKAIRAGAPFAENTAWCRAKLATMHLHNGASAAAAKTLEPSLRERSRNPHVLLAAARLATATAEFDVAADYYRLMLEAGPNHDALVGLGDLEALKGDSSGAEAYYKQVEELHAAHLKGGVHDHVQMAKFLADHDRNPIAALRLAEQHKLTRNVYEADVLAWVYHKNGDQPRAIDAIKRALSQNTPDAEIRYHAGMIAAKAGDNEAALRHLRAAVAMNPRFHPIQARIAMRIVEELSNGQTSASNP